MPKGNSKAYLNSPISDTSEVDTEENSRMIQCILETFNAREPDLHIPEQVEQTINNYFRNCMSKGLRPGNMGLYNALGLAKSEVHDLFNGRNRRNASHESVLLIKKACKALSEYREMLGSQGKLNPATLIFWQKNFDGLEDVQRVDVTAAAAPEANQTPEEIARQIESDIPIDSTCTETD